MDMDKDGYPEEHELQKINTWSHGFSEWHKMMEYIKDRWQYADVGYWEEEKLADAIRYKISTAGWSGNERIIDVMEDNRIFWIMCWHSSERGGHYVFVVKMEEKCNKCQGVD
jgi:hypothetical protein